MRSRTFKEIQKQQKQLSQFTGRDLTRKVSDSTGGFFSFFKRKKNSYPVEEGEEKGRDEIKKIDDSEKKPFWKKRKVIIPTVSIIVIILIGYLFYNSIAGITVDLEVIQEEILVTEKIKADPNASTINSEDLVVPATLILEESVSKSVTAEATGEGEKGEKTKGFVYIFNKTENDIKLTKGVIFTNLGTDLEYTLISDIVLPGGTREDEGPISPTRSDGIALQATEFGEKYNLDQTSPNDTFSVEGFNGLSQLEAKIDSNFEGGTSESFIAVSKQDVDTLKEIEVKALETEAFEEIKRNYDSISDVVLLEETLRFEVEEVTAFPKVGGEAEDGTFNLNIVGKVTGIAIEETQLENLMVEVINNKEEKTESGLDLEQGDIVKVDISEVTRDGDSAIFTAQVRGQSVQELDEEELKNEIKGKTLGKVVSTLEANENIRSVKVKFTPSFTPSFLQRSPLSTGNISLRISVEEPEEETESTEADSEENMEQTEENEGAV